MSSRTFDGNLESAGPGFCPAPPPPPPPPVPGQVPALKINTVEASVPRRPLPNNNNNPYEPPAAIQNAMMTKDKKPFTYTPGMGGKLDLSQIRSPRMARRVAKNANDEGIEGPPKSSLAAEPRPLSAAPNLYIQPQVAVPVFPTNMPPQPSANRAVAPPPARVPSNVSDRAAENQRPVTRVETKMTPPTQVVSPQATPPETPTTPPQVTLAKAPTPWLQNKNKPQEELPEWAKRSSVVRPSSSTSPESPQIQSHQSHPQVLQTIQLQQSPASPMRQQQQQQSPPPPKQQSLPQERVIPLRIEERPSVFSVKNEPGHHQFKQQQQQPSSHHQQRWGNHTPPQTPLQAQVPQFQNQNHQQYQQTPRPQSSGGGTYIVPIMVEGSGNNGVSSYNQQQPIQARSQSTQNQSPRVIVQRGPPSPQIQQGEPGPVQSRSFRVLQKITDTDAPDEVDGEQLRKLQLTEDDKILMSKFKEQVDGDGTYLHQEEDPRYRGAAIPSRAFRLLQNMTDSGDVTTTPNAPRTPSAINKRQNRNSRTFEESQANLPASEQQAPEPKKYTGSAIPSRSFRILQAMTSPESIAKQENRQAVITCRNETSMHPGNQQQGLFLSSSFPDGSDTRSLAEQSQCHTSELPSPQSQISQSSEIPLSQLQQYDPQSHKLKSEGLQSLEPQVKWAQLQPSQIQLANLQFSQSHLSQMQLPQSQSSPSQSQPSQSQPSQSQPSQSQPSQSQPSQSQPSQSQPSQLKPSQSQPSQSPPPQSPPSQSPPSQSPSPPSQSPPSQSPLSQSPPSQSPLSQSPPSQSQRSHLKTPQLQTSRLHKPRLQTPRLQTPRLQTPRLQTPQLQTSHLQTPQLHTPQLQTPQVQTAQLQTPHLQTPHLQTPHLQTPHLQTPHLQTQHLQTPHLQTPHLQTPQLHTPQLQTPQVQTAQLQTPQLQTPQLQTPQLQTPQLRTPQLQTPQLQTPHLQTPHLQTPHLQTQHLQTPHLQTPHLQTPHLQTPHLQTPHLQTPHLQTPHLQTPHLQIPHLQTPHLQTPHLQTPHLQTPHLQIPQPHAPELQTPQLTQLQTPQVQTPQLTQLQTPQVQTPQLTQLQTPQLTQLQTPQVQTPQLTQLQTPQLTQLQTPQLTQLQTPQLTQLQTPQLTQLQTPQLTQLQTPQVQTPQLLSVQLQTAQLQIPQLQTPHLPPRPPPFWQHPDGSYWWGYYPFHYPPTLNATTPPLSSLSSSSSPSSSSTSPKYNPPIPQHISPASYQNYAYYTGCHHHHRQDGNAFAYYHPFYDDRLYAAVTAAAICATNANGIPPSDAGALQLCTDLSSSSSSCSSSSSSSSSCSSSSLNEGTLADVSNVLVTEDCASSCQLLASAPSTILLGASASCPLPVFIDEPSKKLPGYDSNCNPCLERAERSCTAETSIFRCPPVFVQNPANTPQGLPVFRGVNARTRDREQGARDNLISKDPALTEPGPPPWIQNVQHSLRVDGNGTEIAGRVEQGSTIEQCNEVGWNLDGTIGLQDKSMTRQVDERLDRMKPRGTKMDARNLQTDHHSGMEKQRCHGNDDEANGVDNKFRDEKPKWTKKNIEPGRIDKKLEDEKRQRNGSSVENGEVGHPRWNRSNTVQGRDDRDPDIVDNSKFRDEKPKWTKKNIEPGRIDKKLEDEKRQRNGSSVENGEVGHPRWNRSNTVQGRDDRDPDIVEQRWNLDGTIGLQDKSMTRQVDELVDRMKPKDTEMDARNIQSDHHSGMDKQRCPRNDDEANGVDKQFRDEKPKWTKKNIEPGRIDKKLEDEKRQRNGSSVENVEVGHPRWNRSSTVQGRDDRDSDIAEHRWNRIDNASRNLNDIAPSTPMNILHDERNVNESPVVDKVKNNDRRSFDRSEDTNASDSDIDTSSNDSSVDPEPVRNDHPTNTEDDSDSESDSDDSDSYLAYSTGLNPHDKLVRQSNDSTAVKICADNGSATSQASATSSDDDLEETSFATSADRLNATDCESCVDEDDDIMEVPRTDEEQVTHLGDLQVDDIAPHRLSVIPEDTEQNDRGGASPNTIGSDGWQNIADDRNADLTTVSISLPLRFRFSVTENEEDVTTVIVGNSTVRTETPVNGEDTDEVCVNLKLADDADTSADFTLRRNVSREIETREPNECEDNNETDILETEDKTSIGMVLDGKEEKPRNGGPDETNAMSRSNSKTLVAQDDSIDFWETITSGRVSPDLSYNSKKLSHRIDHYSWRETNSKGYQETEELEDDQKKNSVDEADISDELFPTANIDDSRSSQEEAEEDDEEEDEESEPEEVPDEETLESSKDIDDQASPKNDSTPLLELTEAKNDIDESNGRSNLENSKHLLSIQNSRDETDDEDSGVTSDMSRLISEVDTDSECGPTRKINSYKRTQTHSRLFRLLSREDDPRESEEMSKCATARRDRLSLPLMSSGFSYDESHHCSNYSSGLTSPDYSPVFEGTWRRLHGDDNAMSEKPNSPGVHDIYNESSKNRRDPYFENWKKAVTDSKIQEEKVTSSNALKMADSGAAGGFPNWRFRTNVLCPRIKSTKNVPRTVRHNRSAKPVIGSSTSNSVGKNNDNVSLTKYR